MGEARKLTDKMWEMVESGKLADLREIVDADCELKMPGAELTGVAALEQLLRGYLTAFPDLRHHVRHAIESTDGIALEIEVSGTHTGPMQTPQGTIPATGKKVVWESCDYIRTRGGKLVSWHVYHDPTPFLTALGVAPPGGSPGA